MSQDKSSANEGIDVEQRIQEFEERIDVFEDLLEEKDKRIKILEEESVLTNAVKKVLLEYGLSPEKVDEIVETIEEVDSRVKGGDDM